jgi:Caspase domain
LTARLYWLFVSLALCFASATARAQPTGRLDGGTQAVRRFALVIGNNSPFGTPRGMLRYADDDAAATHRLLLEAGVASTLLTRLDADSTRLVDTPPAGAPTKEQVQHVFTRLADEIRRANAGGTETELLLFYSGHGDVEHGEGFVALEDARLTRSELFEFLANSTASRNHVFIDACKSYFLVFERGPGGERTEFTGTLAPQRIPAHLANTGFVLSTSSDRESHEWERYQGGILSHQLRSALRGASDTDRDGHINYAELGAFLTVANQHIDNPRFRPDFMVRPPKDDLSHSILTWNRPHSLLFMRKDWGHFYIEGRKGERLLDAHPHQDQSLQLWLPAERPLFIRKHDDTHEYVVATLSPVEVEALVPARVEIASRGALNLALERLFDRPFKHSDVVAYSKVHRAEHSSAPRDTQEEPSPWTLRHVLGGAAIGAGVASLTLFGVGYGTYLSAADKSQVETARLNRRIESTYQTAGIVALGAAVLGVGWGLVWLSEDNEPRAVAPVVTSELTGVVLSGKF